MGNDIQFNNVMLKPNQVVIESIKLAYEITNAFHNNLNSSITTERKTTNWTISNAGTMKINIDGSARNMLSSQYEVFVALLGVLKESGLKVFADS